jgi:transposase
LGKYFHVNGKHLEEQYVRYLSNFLEWDQLEHASEWVLFPDNLGEYISIDETSLSQGELYTVVTNKDAKGKKGALVAMIKGTESSYVSSILNKIPKNKRNQVKEVTLDMAATMHKITSSSFPNAQQVTDRFHVQRLAYDALQELRIAHRWNAIEQENHEIELCKEQDKEYVPYILENGDTFKQLLVRSRYLLFKQENKWTPAQYQRAEILFRYYPDLKKAYDLCRELGSVYEKTHDKGVAFTRLARWYDKVEKSGFKTFNTLARTIQNHYLRILNFFDNRSTNASAESFNAKIKAFRSQFRGVGSIPFFLFRLSNIYA